MLPESSHELLQVYPVEAHFALVPPSTVKLEQWVAGVELVGIGVGKIPVERLGQPLVPAFRELGLNLPIVGCGLVDLGPTPVFSSGLPLSLPPPCRHRRQPLRNRGFLPLHRPLNVVCEGRIAQALGVIHRQRLDLPHNPLDDVLVRLPKVGSAHQALRLLTPQPGIEDSEPQLS